MSLPKLLAAVAICLYVAACGSASDALPMEVEQNLDNIQHAYARLPTAPQPSIAQVQYVPPVTPGPYIGPPSMETPCVVAPPPCCEVCGASPPCSCIPPCDRRGWTFAFDIAGLEPQVTRGDFGSWPDDAGVAGRITLGYEAPDGLGLRGIVWGFHDEVEAVDDDVELTVGAVHLDVYKAIVSRHGELVLGMGPAFGSVEFRLPDERDRSWFNGGGGSVFADGYYPFLCRPRWELAFAGQTRMSLLTGNWKDDTGFVIPPTDNDSMSVFELSYGWEFRRRFGRCADRFWYLRIMHEYQRWSSDWMSNFLGSAVGLTGTNFSFGVTW